VQSFYQLPDPVFNNPRPIAAFFQVAEERPLALFQIIGFCGLIETVVWKQDPSKAPGDVVPDDAQAPSWLPQGAAGVSTFRRYPDPVVREKKLLAELNNGRLAMIGFAGMVAQEGVNGMNVFETM
jgi:light-harvesting complex I chlorophyll a/b binding protein 1